MAYIESFLEVISFSDKNRDVGVGLTYSRSVLRDPLLVARDSVSESLSFVCFPLEFNSQAFEGKFKLVDGVLVLIDLDRYLLSMAVKT